MSSITLHEAPRRKPWRWWMPAMLLLAGLLATVLIYQQFDHFSSPPVSLVIDGVEVLHDWDVGQWAPLHKAMAAGALALGLVITLALLLLVVPLTLLLVAGIVLAALLGALGLPLLLVGGVALLVLSPLLVLGLLAWWLLKALAS
jgi:phosphoglycerol transferase MdoB-like AlkP superfamily enzyme